MERMYKVNVKFGEHTARSMSMCEFSACLTACGQVWSDHTIAEAKRGYITSMPAISSFASLEQLKEYIAEVCSGQDEDEEPWITMTVTYTNLASE